jgi:hypothetical protein
MEEMMKIKVQLKDAVGDDRIVEQLRLNPWCVNEGADGSDWVEVDVNTIDVKDSV